MRTMRARGAKGEVTVHAPGLLGPWPRALAADIVRGLDVPGLVGLLTRARRVGRPAWRSRADEPESFERLAFGVFGYPPGGNDVPAAALMWEHDAAGSPAGGAADANGPSLVSLRADPVHLRPDLDAARLFDASHFALSRDEAAAMAAALDRHFAPEGVRFEAPHPTRWYARLQAQPDAKFQPPGGAAGGGGAGGALPAGNEGSLWRRRMNEAQMVLHAHPVNQAREARGELAVNSVWFWGTGEPGPVPRRRFDEVVADDPLIRALARRSGPRVRDLAEDPETAGDPSGRRLVAPGPGCLHAVLGRDVESWRRELLDAEERWFRPLCDAVTTGRIRKVVVDAGLRTGESVLEAGGRRARRPEVPVPAGGLAEFLLGG